MVKVEVEISPLAFSKIIDWTSSNTEREVGGYLIGYIEDDKVIITDSTFAVSSSTPTHVQLDEMAQFRIIEELEKRGGKETITGFWHTHPGIGCFMSGTDIATQKIYQALLPEAVAMVNDGNKFAQTRNQNDFEAHFYRVNNSNKANEINFGVITNPNKLVNLLTDYVQSEENVSRIIQSTATTIAADISTNLISKKEFTKNITSLKKSLAKNSAGIQTINESIDEMENASTEHQKQILEKLEQQIESQEKFYKKLLVFISGLAVVSVIGLITVIILLIVL